jgi:hypothetical protein
MKTEEIKRYILSLPLTQISQELIVNLLKKEGYRIREVEPRFSKETLSSGSFGGYGVSPDGYRVISWWFEKDYNHYSFTIKCNPEWASDHVKNQFQKDHEISLGD